MRNDGRGRMIRVPDERREPRCSPAGPPRAIGCTGDEGDEDRERGATAAVTGHKRVLLVDDHEMSRRGLEAMLSTADWVEVVGEAGGCEAGLSQITALRPDIVLLDIRMPGVDGLACLAEIKKLDHPVAVVIVTMYDDRHYVLEAIRRGAAGYLLKEATTGDVLTTLAAVGDGQLAIEPGLLREALSAPGRAARPPRRRVPGSSRSR